jgi:hypothetical protein
MTKRLLSDDVESMRNLSFRCGWIRSQLERLAEVLAEARDAINPETAAYGHRGRLEQQIAGINKTLELIRLAEERDAEARAPAEAGS